MDWPGAYPQVISVGACGWKYEWYKPTADPPYRLWWLQDTTWGYRDIPEPTPADDVYIADFSGRQKAGQQLDIVAPGSWVRGPYPGNPGYSHLPWWSQGKGSLHGRNPGNFFYLGGTSMATPHVSGVVALMLDKNPSLVQSTVESKLKATALPIAAGSMLIWDYNQPAFVTWGLDATGSGLVQANAAVAAS
jgi:subtilisin family serine protease